ncbi:uncharacterized protein [Chelonus insularis]|uniref:uncharacterized protein n=1 Tax=Chelonus insularis TaxID=460826 RepID=UPI00158E70AF|nr:uncharacterized protein LOC118070467 [Chelonus insularis]
MDTSTYTILFGLILSISCTFGQYEQSPKIKDDNYQNSNYGNNKKPNAPVAILKQINRHNEDGSYTYGFEGADGSFKIETKSASGEVRGKYGFVDDSGKVRVVEYGANQHGFQPAGEGITVAPPTLVDETTNGIQYGSNEVSQNQNYDPMNSPQKDSSVQSQLPSRSQLSKSSVFTPAANSELSQQFDYEQRPPASQVYNQGPVQFNPPLNHGSSGIVAPSPSRAVGASDEYNGKVGVLDQLARDYALPKNAAPPLHDISFGYY